MIKATYLAHRDSTKIQDAYQLDVQCALCRGWLWISDIFANALPKLISYLICVAAIWVDTDSLGRGLSRELRCALVGLRMQVELNKFGWIYPIISKSMWGMTIVFLHKPKVSLKVKRWTFGKREMGVFSGLGAPRKEKINIQRFTS